MSTLPLIESPGDLSAQWLTAVLGRGTVTAFEVSRIGTGQMSECYRVMLTYSAGETGPASVVLKVAAADASSRQTGMAMGLYEREVRFYTDIAPGVGGPVAPCHHAAYDPSTGAFDLVLDDAAPATVGDEIRGATDDQAILALRQLGLVHAPLLGDDALAHAAWLNSESPVNQALISALYAGFIDRYADQVIPEHRAVCERFVASFDAHMAAEDAGGRRGLVHGDYRLDNMLFGQAGADRPLTVVDWQTVTWGPAFTDVAYFLGCALPIEQRRAGGDDLLAAYHDALGPSSGVTLDEVREGVRRQSFFGVLMAIVSPMLVERTQRGDAMFMTMIARHCQHVLDTDALSLLPPARTPEPLQPAPADEGRHPPTDEQLWSESWYFDFVDAAQSVGGWLRLGLIPQQGRAWITGVLCGPDLLTVAVLDFDAPLPDQHTAVSSGAVTLAMEVMEPLVQVQVSLTGQGEAFDDPAALLHAQPGRPVQVSLDLTWTTAATPYQYRLSPRYEIPCRISGTVSADGRVWDVAQVPGQRDHSWASRDWWGMDWVWTALHLDDGTHLHGVDLRIPGAPPLSVGYRQRAGEPLVDLGRVEACDTRWNGDLPVSADVRFDDLGTTVTVLGHAPVLLTSTDGRLSRFPRAWGTVTTTDGRTGVGWIEWNLSQG